MKKSAQSVQRVLDDAGISAAVVELPDSTRSAKDAASAIGCEVAQIAKSIIFKGADSGRAILIVASGTNQIDTTKVAGLAGEALLKASAEFVREETGFAIGGVPPCGHKNPSRTFIDRDLLSLGEIWAAAGTPNAVFALKPDDLIALTGGEVIDVA